MSAADLARKAAIPTEESGTIEVCRDISSQGAEDRPEGQHLDRGERDHRSLPPTSSAARVIVRTAAARVAVRPTDAVYPIAAATPLLHPVKGNVLDFTCR